MTTFGITNEGFNLKRFDDCKVELEAEYRDAFGQDINLDADSVLGQIVNISALREADIWEKMQAAYDNLRPSSAEGAALDAILDLTGLDRLGATYSQVDITMNGPDGTIVSPTFTVSDLTNSIFFTIDAQTEIRKENAVQAVVTCPSVAAGDYTVNINGDNYTYTADGTETATAILSWISGLINAEAVEEIEVSSIDDSTILLLSTDLVTSFSVSVSANLTISSVGTLGTFLCTVVGAVAAPANTLVNITTPEAVTSVINWLAAMPGRLVETDIEARLRREQSLAGICGATASTIKNRILTEVENVSNCFVHENDMDEIDGAGRPPHAIETVVLGGLSADIAQKLFEVKAAGTPTFGNTAVSVVDDLGQVRLIKFSRATTVYVWIRYTISYDPETPFPVDGISQIKQATVAFCTEVFTLGKNLLVDKLKVPVYTVQGVRQVLVEVAITSTPIGTPTYWGFDLVVEPSQFTDFSTDRIVVLEGA
jgi:hypothetical protein